MKGKIMNRKNLHEYLFSMPTSDDIYTNYKQAHKKFLDDLQLQATQTEVMQLSEKAIKKAIQELLKPLK